MPTSVLAVVRTYPMMIHWIDGDRGLTARW